jgi:hypothetical protein
MIAPNHVYSIASKAALREVTYLKSNMTKMQAEGVLTSLVKRGWLLKSKYVFLVARSSCRGGVEVCGPQERKVFPCRKSPS